MVRMVVVPRFLAIERKRMTSRLFRIRESEEFSHAPKRVDIVQKGPNRIKIKVIRYSKRWIDFYTYADD